METQVKNMLLFRIKYLENKKDICTINTLDRDPKEKLSHAKSIFKERKRNSIITIRHLIMKCFALFSLLLLLTTKSLSLPLDQLVFYFSKSKEICRWCQYATFISGPSTAWSPSPSPSSSLINAVTTTFKTIGYVFGFSIK